MPVTAKLSRKFYERLGDDIAGELVDWFNAVDSTYQTQLREMNDLNWERFRLELHAQGAELRAELRSELHREIGGLRAEMHAGFSQLGNLQSNFEALTAKMDVLQKEFAQQAVRHNAQIAGVHTGLIKWMFGFWAGSVVAQSAFIWSVLNR